MVISFLEGKQILILGLGSMAFDTAKSLENYKNNIKISACNLAENSYYKQLNAKGYSIYNESDMFEENFEFDLIIKSPGIPLDNILLKKYEDVEVINDIELAYLYVKENQLDIKLIGITGTNGKTSTALFLERFLKIAGYNAQSAGNIGISPLVILNNTTDLDCLIIELSSFQLLNTKKLKLNYSFILNITPDHLNFHSTFKKYVEAKMRILNNQDENDYLFVKEKPYIKFLEDKNINPQIIQNDISDEIKSEIDFYEHRGINFNNLILCYKFGQVIGIDTKYFYKALNAFEGIEHRVEYIQCVNGINFYNDSKATNLSATKESVRRLNNIILLIGGYDSGEDYSSFDTYLDNVKSVICFGQNKDEFVSDKIVERVITLEEAVSVAKQIAKEGDNILLSPASKSFDQYKNYKVRGLHFKRLVKEVW